MSRFDDLERCCRLPETDRETSTDDRHHQPHQQSLSYNENPLVIPGTLPTFMPQDPHLSLQRHISRPVSGLGLSGRNGDDASAGESRRLGWFRKEDQALSVTSRNRRIDRIEVVRSEKEDHHVEVLEGRSDIARHAEAPPPRPTLRLAHLLNVTSYGQITRSSSIRPYPAERIRRSTKLSP